MVQLEDEQGVMGGYCAQAAQQEAAKAQGMVSQLHVELAQGQQKSAQASESMHGAMRVQADRAEQRLARVAADLEEARKESEQVPAHCYHNFKILFMIEL